MSHIGDLLERTLDPVSLDEIDQRVLTILSEDSTISQRALSAKVGMSAPAIADRVSRLERNGVIQRRGIEVDWSALGYPMLVILPINISGHVDGRVVVERLQSLPHLTELLVLTGTYDMMARFRLRDYSHLQELLLEKIWQIPGIERVETMLSLGKVRGEHPLSRLVLPQD